MATGPSSRAKLNLKKAHLHPLKDGKEYTIHTNRDLEGKGKIAFMAFLFKGKDRQLLLKVDELSHDKTYSVRFTAKGSGESLLLTYWHRKGGKWIQLSSNKVKEE